MTLRIESGFSGLRCEMSATVPTSRGRNRHPECPYDRQVGPGHPGRESFVSDRHRVDVDRQGLVELDHGVPVLERAGRVGGP